MRGHLKKRIAARQLRRLRKKSHLGRFYISAGFVAGARARRHKKLVVAKKLRPTLGGHRRSIGGSVQVLYLKLLFKKNLAGAWGVCKLPLLRGLKKYFLRRSSSAVRRVVTRLEDDAVKVTSKFSIQQIIAKNRLQYLKNHITDKNLWKLMIITRRLSATASRSSCRQTGAGTGMIAKRDRRTASILAALETTTRVGTKNRLFDSEEAANTVKHQLLRAAIINANEHPEYGKVGVRRAGTAVRDGVSHWLFKRARSRSGRPNTRKYVNHYTARVLKYRNSFALVVAARWSRITVKSAAARLSIELHHTDQPQILAPKQFYGTSYSNTTIENYFYQKLGDRVEFISLLSLHTKNIAGCRQCGIRELSIINTNYTTGFINDVSAIAESFIKSSTDDLKLSKIKNKPQPCYSLAALCWGSLVSSPEQLFEDGGALLELFNMLNIYKIGTVLEVYKQLTVLFYLGLCTRL